MQRYFTTFFAGIITIGTCIVPASAQTEPPAQKAARAGKRLGKLQSDLDRAASRASFTGAQKEEFNSLRIAMQKEFDRRRNGEKMNRKAMRGYIEALLKLVDSEAFQPEDRETLRKDFERLRSARKRQR